jgi:cytochrome c-type biogenesis protein CcmF
MVSAHLGVAVFIVGVTLVKAYGIEQNVTMDKGETVQVGGYDFTFGGVVPVNGPNYSGGRALSRCARKASSSIHCIRKNASTTRAACP